MLTAAATSSTTMDLLAAPSDLMTPETVPSRMTTVPARICGRMYSRHSSAMSCAPIIERAGSTARSRTGVLMMPMITDSTTVWDASLSALCFSPLPRYLAMAVAAPIPSPVPSPETIQ